MGNKQGKWFPEASLCGWTRHSEERYTRLLAHRPRPSSRKSSRKYVSLKTIEEEWLRLDDCASVPNNQKQIPQDPETHRVAQMPPETVQSPDVTQPTALMDKKPKEVLVKMKRIQEEKSDGLEQPCPVTSPLAEDPVLPPRRASGEQKDLMEKRMSDCFCDRAETEKLEEAKTVRVWNAEDHLTPEEEAIIQLEEHLFEYKGSATRKKILDLVEHGMDGLHCEDEALQNRDGKGTECPQETSVEYPLVLLSQETLQSRITEAEVNDRL